MITALQGAKLNSATKLCTAREALLDCRSSIVWENDEHKIADAAAGTALTAYDNERSKK